jgi:hypothetical protein
MEDNENDGHIINIVQLRLSLFLEAFKLHETTIRKTETNSVRNHNHK